LPGPVGVPGSIGSGMKDRHDTARDVYPCFLQRAYLCHAHIQPHFTPEDRLASRARDRH
jgi:hypothetical protein